MSLGVIGCLLVSLGVTRCHWLSSGVIGHHQTLLGIIEQHWASLKMCHSNTKFLPSGASASIFDISASVPLPKDKLSKLSKLMLALPFDWSVPGIPHSKADDVISLSKKLSRMS